MLVISDKNLQFDKSHLQTELTNKKIETLTGQSKTQVTSGGVGTGLRTIAGYSQKFTYANWGQAVNAAKGQTHQVTVGKKRVESVTKQNCSAFYEREEKIAKSKQEVLERVSAAPATLTEAFKKRSSQDAVGPFKTSLAGKTLLYQAAYMSGDMFAVGGALRLDSKTRALIIYDDNTENAAKRLLDFYLKQCDAIRILAVKVNDAKAEYKAFGETPNNMTLAGIKSTQHVFFQSPGGATKLVGDQLSSKWGNSPLRGDWISKELWHVKRIDRFLELKNVAKNNRYVVVWTRFSGKGATVGAAAGAHPELDSSYAMLRQVISQRANFNRKIIVVGPDRRNKLGTLTSDSNVSIWGEYYRDPKWPKGTDRAMEYGVFTRMQEDPWNNDVVHLGMRSGAMDAAALLNMKTYFIEDANNQQIDRTKKWTLASNTNDYYKRIDVEYLPTLTGQIMSKNPQLSLEEVQKVKKVLKYRAGNGPNPGSMPLKITQAADAVGSPWARGFSNTDIQKVVNLLKT